MVVGVLLIQNVLGRCIVRQELVEAEFIRKEGSRGGTYLNSPSAKR